jgi:hypothetical protein
MDSSDENTFVRIMYFLDEMVFKICMGFEYQLNLVAKPVCLAPLLCHTCRSGPHSTLSRPATPDPAAI